MSESQDKHGYEAKVTKCALGWEADFTIGWNDIMNVWCWRPTERWCDAAAKRLMKKWERQDARRENSHVVKS